MANQGPLEREEPKAAVFGVYAAGTLGAVSSVGALIVRMYPQVPTWIETTLWVSGLVLLLVAVGLYTYLERQAVRSTLSSRQAQHMSNSAALVAVLAGILVMTNYIASRHHKRLDLTVNKQYSLSEQTRKILAGLDSDVTVTSFYSLNNPSGQQVRDLLAEYRYASPHVKFEAVDPERNPARARTAGITREVVVMEAKGRKQEVTGFSEQDFTSGLLKLLRPNPKVIYFLQGHGEHDPDGTEANGFSVAKGALEKQNYKTARLVLAQQLEVPKDASVLVIAGPMRAVLPKERQAIDRFIDGGGDVLLLLNPRVQSGLEDLVKRFGVSADNNLVVDLKSHFFIDAAAPLIVSYRYHDITHSLSMSYFPGVRSLTLADKPVPGVTATQLAMTSDRSYGLANPNASGQISIDPKQDKQGPFSVAMAIDYVRPGPSPAPAAKPPTSHLVVFGNSTFAANNQYPQVANGDFFSNSVNWLAEEEELIAIPPKPPEQRKVELSNRQWQLVWLLSIFVLPLMMVFIGGMVWWRRR